MIVRAWDLKSKRVLKLIGKERPILSIHKVDKKEEIKVFQSKPMNGLNPIFEVRIIQNLYENEDNPILRLDVHNKSQKSYGSVDIKIEELKTNSIGNYECS